MQRYRAPAAADIWDEQSRLARLSRITATYAVLAAKSGVFWPRDSDDAEDAVAFFTSLPSPTVDRVAAAEQRHGHEIVGFLDAYLELVPSAYRPLVHYGLTSSDLTEYDLFHAIRDHARGLAALVHALVVVLGDRATEHDGLARAGRTHGQTAERTSLSHQLRVFRDEFAYLRDQIEEYTDSTPFKTPGPVGYSPIRQPPPDLRVIRSTQVIPRTHLIEWAALYLRLSNALETLATFIRLGARSEIGEFAEGAADARQGSSAMPGKRNPIESERVCGLARIARGYFSALAEVSGLWEDRDLSNSSTERIAVRSLAETAEFMLGTMTRVVTDLQVDRVRMLENAADPATRANTNQNEYQLLHRVGPIEASRAVAKGVK